MSRTASAWPCWAAGSPPPLVHFFTRRATSSGGRCLLRHPIASAAWSRTSSSDDANSGSSCSTIFCLVGSPAVAPPPTETAATALRKTMRWLVPSALSRPVARSAYTGSMRRCISASLPSARMAFALTSPAGSRSAFWKVGCSCGSIALSLSGILPSKSNATRMHSAFSLPVDSLATRMTGPVILRAPFFRASSPVPCTI
mmetsp:Transcript_11479/g.29360  ORF Transcript_11479/g.29360 Transcript_11479/m.29360 type:complete len:200 (+) Transcript_11479:627-1226(+)